MGDFPSAVQSALHAIVCTLFIVQFLSSLNLGVWFNFNCVRHVWFFVFSYFVGLVISV